MADERLSLLARFKRHHAYRVATVYAIAAWVILQLANSVFPDFGLPRSSVRLVIVMLLLGFPVVLTLAWWLIKPVDPDKLSHWQRRRWRLGLLLSVLVMIFAGLSGAYIWTFTAKPPLTAVDLAATTVLPAFNPPPNSIAVLPFRNLSNNPAQQYLSDGLTQELTDDLSLIAGLRVIAWQSMEGYRNTALPVGDIGKNLNVANILTGSIMREGEILRVSVALVNTITGNQVWSSRYDQTFKDVFAMQDNISKAIVEITQGKLDINTQLVAAATSNPEAHDAYLRGKAAFALRTEQGLNDALKQFQRAIKLDPRYAEAYAQLASVYGTLPEVTSMPLQEANARAMQAVQQALAINPDLAAAHAVLANIYISEHKLDQAKAQLLRTLVLDPNNAAAHASYGFMLPLADALGQYQQAAVLDPGNWAAQMNLGTTYVELGKNDQALQAFQAAHKLSPDNIDAPLEIAFLYHQESRLAEAVNVLSGIKTHSKDDARILDASRLAYQALQDPKLHDQALATLDKLAAANISAFNHYYLATSYVILGENDRAIGQITKFCSSAPDTCNDIAVDNHYAALRADPRFQTLVAKYGLKH
ncbi:MAG: tetratricopeptide repeat protein [Gammaproteobacteria bacterium]